LRKPELARAAVCIELHREIPETDRHERRLLVIPEPCTYRGLQISFIHITYTYIHAVYVDMPRARAFYFLFSTAVC